MGVHTKSEMSPSLGSGQEAQVMFATDFYSEPTLQITVNDRIYNVRDVKDFSVNKNESRGRATANELRYGEPFSKTKIAIAIPCRRAH
jgi:hypothetical protein